MNLSSWIGPLCVSAGLLSTPVYAQDGAALFKTYCATCHEVGGNSQAPSREVLRRMSPEQILQALEKGTMKTQAAERSRAQRHVLAEYLSGKPFGSEPAIIPSSAFCGSTTGPFRASVSGPGWNGWGVGLANARFQSGEAAGMTANEIPRHRASYE